MMGKRPLTIMGTPTLESNGLASPMTPIFDSAARRPGTRRLVRVGRRFFLICFCILVLVLLFFRGANREKVRESVRESVHRLPHMPDKFFGQNDFNTSWRSRCTQEGISIFKPAIPPSSVDERWMHQKYLEIKNLFDDNPPEPDSIEHPDPNSVAHVEMSQKLDQLVTLTDEEAQRSRETHRKVVDGLPEWSEWKKTFQGRGVVMLAGGHYTEHAATSLAMLRLSGSELPVEVWSAGEWEEKDGWCKEMEQYGMKCRRLNEVIHLDHIKHPYQWKIFTILFSSFKEILFLDADSFPLKNPDDIFTSEVYNRTGALLWPDYWGNTESSWTKYIVGLLSERSKTLPQGMSAESGQLYWNKERHWKSLLLATYYNYHGPNFYYSLLNSGWAGWGDKDTFPTALKALKEDYYMSPHGVLTIFLTETATGIGLIRADPRNDKENLPMLLHANWIKWSTRDMNCVACPPIWPKIKTYDKNNPPAIPPYKSFLEDTHSGADHVRRLSAALRQSQRVINPDIFQTSGLDPELMLWKAMEYTACRSKAWYDQQQCGQARLHMAKTFGVSFEPIPPEMEDETLDVDLCVVDPKPPSPTSSTSSSPSP